MRGLRKTRGFTLVELMVVVAIVAALSTLAVYGVRKYVFASKAAEPVYMIGQIKTAQESWREEFHAYYDVSTTIDNYYPATPKDFKRHWVNTAHPDYAKWNHLGVTTSNPVHFGYAVKAGGPSENPPSPGTTQAFNWPATSEPWYVIKSVGDLNANGTFSKFVGSSFTSEVFAENDGE
jgi:prepilin-type N-terminal cleavage/methylation domain-containing protein